MSGKLKKKSLTTPTLQHWFSFPFFFPSYLLHKHLLKKQVLTVPDTLDILLIAGNKKQHLLNFWSCFLLFLLSFYLISTNGLIPSGLSELYC